MQQILLISIAILIVTVSAFRPINSKFLKLATRINMSSEPPANDPALEAIKAKYRSNPNYNPLTDPEAAPIIENLIPSEVRDFTNALERFRIALEDATSGPDAVGDIDESSKQFDKKDLISSPQSKWFKEGRPNEDYSQSKADEAIEKLKKKYPEVPFK